MTGNGPNTTVYYDGSCPLCASEISHYSKQDRNRQLAFVDVSKTHASLPVGLSRQQAMARFHVMARDGRLIDGAEAFAEVWANLSKWRWAARAAALPGVIPALNFAYSISLLTRPALSRLLGRLQRSWRGSRTGCT